MQVGTLAVVSNRATPTLGPSRWRRDRRRTPPPLHRSGARRSVSETIGAHGKGSNGRSHVTRIARSGVVGGVSGATVTTVAYGVSTVEDVYRAEASSLLGMLWVYTGDRATAEDLDQEAFARLQVSRHRMRDPARAASYVPTIAFNLAKSRFRRLRTAATIRPEHRGA